MFLNNLSSLINSLKLWSSDHDTSMLSDEQKEIQGRFLNEKLSEFDTVSTAVVCPLVRPFTCVVVFLAFFTVQADVLA